MKYLIISGNPKTDGLNYSVMEQIKKGAEDGGAEVEILTVKDLTPCKMCNGGWGICRDQNRCAFENDGFGDAHKAVKEADKICIISPVYWMEVSEGLKTFLDRLRRCEARSTAEEGIKGKQVLLVASAGGSGFGLMNCLSQMERFTTQTGAVVYDFIPINRWNNDYKKASAYAAARAMAEGRKTGDTI